MATSTSARGKEPSPARTGSGAVVVTKLRPPASRPRLVPRAALVEQLAAAGAKLTLVAAPAGWGKTTLLAAWAQREEARRFAWLAVDRWDNDPVRFWTYVIEAFETREAGVGAEALALLGAPGAPVRESALPALVNALEPVAHGLTLVLDDYHLVDNAEVHEDVAYLLDRLPPGLGVVVLDALRPAPPAGADARARRARRGARRRPALHAGGGGGVSERRSRPPARSRGCGQAPRAHRGVGCGSLPGRPVAPRARRPVRVHRGVRR